VRKVCVWGESVGASVGESAGRECGVCGNSVKIV